MAASPNDMSCKELVELVTDYLEGALSPADQRRFELHLGKCEGCKVYIDQIRLTIKAAGQLTEDSIGLTAKEELVGGELPKIKQQSGFGISLDSGSAINKN